MTGFETEWGLQAKDCNVKEVNKLTSLVSKMKSQSFQQSYFILTELFLDFGPIEVDIFVVSNHCIC